MSKSKNKSQEKRQGFDWEQLGKKGKRDATIKEEIDSLRESFINVLLNGEEKITEKKFTTDILPELEHKVEDLCSKYEIDRKEQDRRKDSILKELTNFYHSYITTETYAELSIDAVQIYNILNALKNIVDEVEFKLVKDHIALRFMDPSRINLVQIFLTAKTYIFFREGKACVDLDDFAKVVKANTTEKSVTTLRFTPSEVLITKESETYRTSVHTSLSQLDLDIEEIPMGEIFKIQYPFSFAISRGQFDYILNELDVLSEIVNIKVNMDHIEFYNSGQIGSRTIPFEEKDIKYLTYTEYEKEKEQEEDTEENSEEQEDIFHALSAFSYKFLDTFSKLSSLLTSNDPIHFFARSQHPLKIYIELPLIDSRKTNIGTLKAWSFLACRAEEAEFDEDDELDDF